MQNVAVLITCIAILDCTCNCTVIATNDSQVLTSPGWPGGYPNGANCWVTLLSPSSDAKILITFDFFEVVLGMC